MTREPMKLLLGAGLVYGIVAACSAADSTGGGVSHSVAGAAGTDRLIPMTAGGNAGGTSSADSGTDAETVVDAGEDHSVTDSAIDAVVDVLVDAADALTDPVPDASAAPPQVDTVPCDQTWDFGGSTPYTYAVVSYPGASPTDLANVVAVARYSSSTEMSVYPPGTTHMAIGPYLGNGVAMAACGPVSNPMWDQVTFVRPAPSP